MKKLFACLALLATLGCIEFDKQTLLFRHYPEKDTLVIWQQYEGIYGEDGFTNRERGELHSVVAGQRTFFFTNWILEYDAEMIKDYVKEARAALKQGEAPPERVKEKRHLLALAQLVQKSVTIQNGPFYLNPKGHLSATQQVTVRNVGRIIRETNIALRTAFLTGGFIDTREKGFPNTELFEKSARAKMKYISLDGQELRFRVPMSAEEYQKEIGDHEEELKKVREAGLFIDHNDNLLTLTIGKVKATEASVSMDIPEWTYKANATEAVKERYGLAKGFDSAKARAKFLQDSDVRFGKKRKK